MRKNSQKKYLFTFLLIFFVSLIFINGTNETEAEDEAEKNIVKNESFYNLSTEKILELTNIERTKEGLGNLETDSLLQAVAEKKALEMSKEGYFSHISPDGKNINNWAKESSYKYNVFGENLAEGFNDTESLVNAWMNSLTHRKNIMKNEYKDVGIGMEVGEYMGKEVVFVVVFYASPREGLWDFLFE